MSESATDRQRGGGPAVPVLLYDGQCRLCQRQSERLVRMAGLAGIERRDFHQPEALADCPGVTQAQCERSMILVMPDGRRLRGVEAAVEALRGRAVLGPLSRVYYVPGVRQLADLGYRIIAANRHRLGGGKTDCGEACGVRGAGKKS